MGPRPGLLPRPVCVALVPDVAQPDQEHVEALPRAAELAGRVVEGAVEVPGGLDCHVGQRDLDDVVGGEHAGDELGVAPVVLAPGVRRRPLHPGDGGHGAVEAERAQLARHVEAGGAALVADPGLLEAEGPLRDLGGVGAEVAVHHLAGEGVERRGGDRLRVDVQADGGNMGHGKPPPRRCGKGYRMGRYSKPIAAPRARGKKLRRGGGGPNGFLISSFGICETLFQILKLRVPAFRFRCYRIALLKLRSHPDDADLDMLKSCTNVNFHLHDESSSRIVISAPARGRSSAGRALDWQSRGQGFDSPRLHHCTFQLLGNRKLFCYTGSWRNG